MFFIFRTTLIRTHYLLQFPLPPKLFQKFCKFVVKSPNHKIYQVYGPFQFYHQVLFLESPSTLKGMRKPTRAYSNPSVNGAPMITSNYTLSFA